MWHSVMSTGNYVADYKFRKVTCEHCRGEGIKEISIGELRVHLMVISIGKTWKHLLAVYRRWKNNGQQIVCPDCDGIGAWEERR